jgi:hypothetical protein
VLSQRSSHLRLLGMVLLFQNLINFVSLLRISSSLFSNSLTLSPQLFEPIRRISRLLPQSINEPLPNVFIVDFGQNTAGTKRHSLVKKY